MAELIPHARRPIPQYPALDFILRVFLGVFALSVVVYAVISMFVAIGTNQAKEVEAQAEEKKAEQRVKRDPIVFFASQIESAKAIVDSYVPPQSALEIIESVIHPTVVARSFETVFTPQKQITVSFKGADLNAFWEQFRIIRAFPAISKISISALAITTDGVEFTTAFAFDETKLK